ncbi:2-succinyl-5-enolpyruvyl-6-hydroxy-3-cyclohexene-1-carboxylic-acid synthase [uncultured Muribaculum sp.]|uniref:2-succinyl-5-enolpyruvyl-6-hydroxy-3- cyclohexene-1-carboxylic-acid synthase n=1 Tax=uncultured Muribaculum sp. TaxID=1918613 RepID=UPI0025B142A0|nr:2-succinyl-5-enolpyruvyl-6-hydroxy-3-cyclohexene-1-carboxylic-acid synthase [uncultured Muribaculum sp.]
MLTSAKPQCDILVEMLKLHGVHEAVISPGSRCTPLIIALTQCSEIATTVIVDERSAAFIAVGKASISERPVVLVCTSGTAVLNYAPAVAEAYYRHMPLIIVSADRPLEWIDQDDSQTLQQFEALNNYVKRSYDLADNCNTKMRQWYANRIINDAIIMCKSPQPGPVHINMQFDNPLNTSAESTAYKWNQRSITTCTPEQRLSDSDADKLMYEISQADSVLIIGGFHNPDNELLKSLEKIADVFPNISVMCETVANMPSHKFIHDIDATVSAVPKDRLKELYPEIVITFGGALVSRMIKQFIRESNRSRHWHVSISDTTVDCFLHLERHIRMSANGFFKQVANISKRDIINTATPAYGEIWKDISLRSRDMHCEFLKKSQWTTLKAAHCIFSMIPNGWALQLSNGTAVRYAQLFPSMQVSRSDCNRGVSGIDGCTSTAIGASSVLKTTTLLVSGDMSAMYDMGAFAAPCITSQFKMVVLCNNGGEIFRFIESTRSLPQLDKCFAVSDRKYPVEKIAETFGFKIFLASSHEELKQEFLNMCAENNQPAILCVYTDGDTSADALRNYLSLKLDC